MCELNFFLSDVTDPATMDGGRRRIGPYNLLGASIGSRLGAPGVICGAAGMGRFPNVCKSRGRNSYIR